MYIDPNDSARIQQYLPEGSTIHQLVQLRSSSDPNHRDLLAITSSSLVKYFQNRKEEVADIVPLHHITSLRIATAGIRVGLIVFGAILTVIGLITSIALSYSYGYNFYSDTYEVYYDPNGLIIGLPLLIVGIVLILVGIFLRRGDLRIMSYNPEEAIVDARFSRTQTGQVIEIAKSLQRLLSVESTSQPISGTYVPPPSSPPATPPPAAKPAAKPKPAAKSTAKPKPVAKPKPMPSEPGTWQALPPGTKKCDACGAIIPQSQLFCEECGEPQ